MLLQRNELKNKISTIILCAGEGSRLKEVTKDIPKPLIKIESLDNKPILQITINNLINLGLNQIAIIKGYLGNKIDEFISNLIQDIKEKLLIIDASENYKLGPLYSLLSIMKYSSFIKDDMVYIIIPGDTIFEYSLLNNILEEILDKFDEIQQYPLLFYRKIRVSVLKQKPKSINQNITRLISIIDIEEISTNKFLARIQQEELRRLAESDYVNQLIPVFVFPYDFFKEIKKLETEISVKTLWEIINYMRKEGRTFYTVKIDDRNEFYDIDYGLNLIQFKSSKKRKKKNNSK